MAAAQIPRAFFFFLPLSASHSPRVAWLAKKLFALLDPFWLPSAESLERFKAMASFPQTGFPSPKFCFILHVRGLSEKAIGFYDACVIVIRLPSSLCGWPQAAAFATMRSNQSSASTEPSRVLIVTVT